MLLTSPLQCDSAPTLFDFFLFLRLHSTVSSSFLLAHIRERGQREAGGVAPIIPENHFIPIISNLPTIGDVLCGHGASGLDCCDGYWLVVALAGLFGERFILTGSGNGGVSGGEIFMPPIGNELLETRKVFARERRKTREYWAAWAMIVRCKMKNGFFFTGYAGV